MIEYKEPICTSCDRREVCKFRDEFLKAQQTADDITVCLGNGAMKKLRHFDYIERVELKCKHWKLESKGGAIR